MTRIIIFFVLSVLLLPASLSAREGATVHYSTFEAGSGPSLTGGVYNLIDNSVTGVQSNAIAFDAAVAEESYRELRLRCRLRVLEGGEGGSIMFLNALEYGRRGPAPFLKSWVEPNLAKTFAVGIDVNNPAGDEPFGPRGNYRGMPQREVSLHWDGREIVKRLAPEEFRGHFFDLEIRVDYVVGGAEITVSLAKAKVYDRFFIAGMIPYEPRLAIGAGTRQGMTTVFDIRDIEFRKIEPAPAERSPSHFDIFNFIKIDNSSPSREKEILLPPLHWAYGRIIMTLEIHDAGSVWDKWDRIGSVNIIDSKGNKNTILSFITSFRTPWKWQVDVSRFRPWLDGRVKFELEAGRDFEADQGFIMSVALDFYHGVPELVPYRVVPLWNGEARYGPPDNHFRDFFKPRTVAIDETAKAARLFISTTGHSKVGEFTPAKRTLIFTPEKEGDNTTEKKFKNILWKTDNYLNPNRPQFGTWKYSRAGWAPGDIVRPWRIDLTPYIVPGKTAELRYEPEPYDFSGIPEDKRPVADEIRQAVHFVNAYLILYRSPEDLVEAPYLQVQSVEDGSNASRADIVKGDYLDSYDGKKTRTIAELREAIKVAEKEGRERLEVVIYRGKKRLEKKISPGRIGVLLEEQ